MFAEERLLAGWLLLHAVWLVAYLTGALLDRGSRTPATPAEALAELVVRTATGLALWGFGVLVLGVAGWLNPLGVLGLLIAFALAARRVHGPALLTAAFWRASWARVTRAVTPANLGFYYVALLTMVPAIMPDLESDTLRGHLALAADWAVHGRVYADVLLRLPYYATNFQLLYALFDTLGLAAFVHLLPALCGGLVLLAARAAVTLVEERLPAAPAGWPRLSRALVTALVPLSLALSPVFLRWNDTAMLDIPIELYAFVPALCLVAALTAKLDLRWSAVCCAGFFLGMKLSFPILGPYLLIVVWALIAAAGGSRRARATACLVVVVLASPWYVRNAIYDHDPVPPVINMALHHPDASYDREDYLATLRDLHTDLRLGALVRLPFDAWAHPEGPNFREAGSIGLYLFLYVPVLLAAAGLMFGTRTPARRAVVALAATATVMLLYCLATSYLLRYLLICQPALAASVAGALLLLPQRAFTAALRTAAAVISIIPSWHALPWYHEHVLEDYRYLEGMLPSDEARLRLALGGYTEAGEILRDPLFARRPAPRVLLVGPMLEYTFHRAGIETLGDWFGPGRWRDLIMFMENDRLRDYVDHFQIGAVVVDRRSKILSDTQIDELQRGLRKLGFHELPSEPAFYVAVR